MNINIYSKYKVKYNCYGGEIDEENSTPDDITFKKFNDETSIIENGGILAERIARYIKQTDFQEITINDKNIVYKGTHFTGRIIHIAFFSDKQILITQSIGIEELQAINKQVEELGWK